MNHISEPLRQLIGRMSKFVESPEGERQRREAGDRYDRLLKQKALANAYDRSIPRDPDTLKIAVDRTPASTPLFARTQQALSWRHKNARALGCPPLVFGVLGSFGRGKTCALSHAVVWHESSAHYTTASVITQTQRYREGQLLWTVWESVDLLAIDEIGKESKPELLTDLLLTRYNNGLATLLAGNISAQEFTQRYVSGTDSGRLIDRLQLQKRRGQAVYYEDSGESFRKVAR